METLTENLHYVKADKNNELPLTRQQFNHLVRTKKDLLGDIEGSEGEYGDWTLECFQNYYYSDNSPYNYGDINPLALTDAQWDIVVRIWELD